MNILIIIITDKFHDDGTLWSSSKPIVRKDKDHAFIDYTYKRKKVSSFCGCMYTVLDFVI
jgi:hypothetical protein